MGSDVDKGGVAARPGPDVRDATTISVALGRRVEVIGDLLLPPEPTDSSRAACRDVARRLRNGRVRASWSSAAAWPLPGLARRPAAALGPRRSSPSVRARSPHAPTPRWSRSMARRSGDPELVPALEPRGVAVHAPSTSPARRERARAPCWSGPARSGPTRNPPDRRRAGRRPALAGRDGAPRRPAPGAPVRHLTPALPAAAPLPVGAASGAGRHRAAAADRLRGRRPRPRVPLAAPAERAAARLRRHLVLPLRRHRGDRRRAAGRAGRGGRHHLTGHLAGARRRGPPRPVGERAPRDRARSPTRSSRSTAWTRWTPRAPAVEAGARGRSPAERSSPSSPTSTRASSPARAPPPRSSASTAGGSGCHRRSCTTARSRPSRSRPAPTCTCA